MSLMTTETSAAAAARRHCCSSCHVTAWQDRLPRTTCDVAAGPQPVLGSYCTGCSAPLTDTLRCPACRVPSRWRWPRPLDPPSRGLTGPFLLPFLRVVSRQLYNCSVFFLQSTTARASTTQSCEEWTIDCSRAVLSGTLVLFRLTPGCGVYDSNLVRPRLNHCENDL